MVAIALSAFTVWFAMRKATLLFDEFATPDNTLRAERQVALQEDDNAELVDEPQTANVPKASFAINETNDNRVFAATERGPAYTGAVNKSVDQSLRDDIEEAIRRFEAEAASAKQAAVKQQVPTAAASSPAMTPLPTTASEQSQTAALPRPAQPAPRPTASMSANEIEAMLDRARKLMAQGDISSARLLYEYLARRGVGVGALELARSFDPDHMKTVFVKGMKPDLEQARIWYRKAAELGERQAQQWLARAETR